MRTRTTQPRKVNVVTLGCAKNVFDSEVLMGQLRANSYDVEHESKSGDAGIVIINTCGFIESAKQESIDTIIRFSEAKEEGLVDRVYVTGCLSERYKDELKDGIPEVDAWFGTRDLPRLLKTLKADYKRELVGERLLTTPAHYAYLKIAEGCDRPCAFCAIPLMRGKHVSTPMEDLVKQAKSLAATAYSSGIRTFFFDVSGNSNKNGQGIAKQGGGYFQRWKNSWLPYERVQPGWVTFLQQNTRSDQAVWTAPFVDATGSGLIMAVSKPLWYGDTLIGVVANDVNLGSLEKVLLYGTWGTAYSFLTNREAQTMVHPNLAPPSALSSSPIFPDIGDLETVNGAPAAFLTSVRAGLLAGATGTLAIEDGLSLTKRGSALDGFAVAARSLEYFYAPVPGADFMVCYVLVTPDDVHYRIPMSPLNVSGATAYYDKLTQVGPVI